MKIKDAVALVTGGSEGIGRAIAEALKNEGASVTITGRNEEKLRATADQLGVEAMAGARGSAAGGCPA